MRFNSLAAPCTFSDLVAAFRGKRKGTLLCGRDLSRFTSMCRFRGRHSTLSTSKCKLSSNTCSHICALVCVCVFVCVLSHVCSFMCAFKLVFSHACFLRNEAASFPRHQAPEASQVTSRDSVTRCYKYCKRAHAETIPHSKAPTTLMEALDVPTLAH